jgi:hypothetical protein
VVSSASTQRRVRCCRELTCDSPVSVKPSNPAAGHTYTVGS